MRESEGDNIDNGSNEISETNPATEANITHAPLETYEATGEFD